MQIENEKINRDKYYSVGYSPELDKYVLAFTVTWVAWYNRYYEISEEEYNSFGSAKLDETVETLYKQGCNSERFLFSEKKEENNQQQLDLLSKF